MTKKERNFVKFIGKKICEVLSSYNYRYSDELTNYGKEKFKEARYNEVQYFIDWAKDRGVNSKVVEYLQSMNEVLYNDKVYIF